MGRKRKEDKIVEELLRERENTYSPEEDKNMGEYLETEGEAIFKKISLSSIVIEEQPRKSMNQESIEELAQSLKIHGLINPIEVAPTETFGRYRLVSGHRRVEAARRLGWKKIMAKIVSHIDPEKDVLPRQLTENLQRENLDPIDEALALAQLAERGLSHQKIADLLGKSKTRVTLSLKITHLILRRFVDEPVSSVSEISKEGLKEIKEKLKNIPKEVLIELGSVADKPYFEEVFELVKKGASLSQVRQFIKEKKTLEEEGKDIKRSTGVKFTKRRSPYGIVVKYMGEQVPVGKIEEELLEAKKRVQEILGGDYELKELSAYIIVKKKKK